MNNDTVILITITGLLLFVGVFASYWKDMKRLFNMTHKTKLPFNSTGGKADAPGKKSALTSVENAFKLQAEKGGLVHVAVVHVPVSQALSYMGAGPAAVKKALNLTDYPGAQIFRNNVLMAETEYEDSDVSS